MPQSDARKALQHAIENSRKQSEQHDRQLQFMEGKKKSLNRFRMEWHRKFFLAVVCVVLFFIGAPLGAIIRKGGLGLPTMYALGLFIFYQLLTMMGERMAKNQIVDAWLGMWMSTMCLFPLALYITYRASREARMQKGIYGSSMTSYLRTKFSKVKP
jgi:lipopolysaccharide export system permease protein